MSHTPSNPGTPTPSIYPYRVAAYLPQHPLHPTIPDNLYQYNLPQPYHTPLAPPRAFPATIFNITAHPTQHPSRAPIFHRTASGRLFATTHQTSNNAQVPSKVKVNDAQQPLNHPTQPLRRITHNLPGALRGSTIHPHHTKTSHVEQQKQHAGMYSGTSRPTPKRMNKHPLPIPNTLAPLPFKSVFGHREARAVGMHADQEVKIHRAGLATKVVVKDNFEAFGRRSCEGVVEGVGRCDSGVGNDAGVDDEDEVNSAGQDVWVQIAG
ncbi:hypothetical protein T440DRAFT_510423 [Plenodomus tracheiphilus IPT5]|uniref:Uncharacterized protein n=1 Tax=Plenodomus tracheiphilus IPT5 TaxID=1408161 RepID=A0A6A7AVB5_9PLEO|nr:hypothetical protein T440DRAFT_510423 [Plenodomus tracheiphilus IPT5]